MALIKCPECECEVSDKAKSCPKCGCPIEDFEQYWRHASTLRNWFVVYGVGAIAYMISGNSIMDDKNILFVKLISIAVGLQIFLALINKISHYYEAKSNEFWASIANCFAIDVVLDCATFGLFLWSAWIFVSSL